MEKILLLSLHYSHKICYRQYKVLLLLLLHRVIVITAQAPWDGSSSDVNINIVVSIKLFHYHICGIEYINVLEIIIITASCSSPRESASASRRCTRTWARRGSASWNYWNLAPRDRDTCFLRTVLPLKLNNAKCS